MAKELTLSLFYLYFRWSYGIVLWEIITLGKHIPFIHALKQQFSKWCILKEEFDLTQASTIISLFHIVRVAMITRHKYMFLPHLCGPELISLFYISVAFFMATATTRIAKDHVRDSWDLFSKLALYSAPFCHRKQFVGFDQPTKLTKNKL